jgi:polysaccharide biosynthesis transport protein
VKSDPPEPVGSLAHQPYATVALPYGGHGGNHNQQGLGPRRLKSILYRQRWLILAGLASVVVAVAVLTRFWPRTYESSVTFIVDKPGHGTAGPPLATLERAGGSNDLETEIELIQSRRVLDTVVDRLDLHVAVQGGFGESRPRAVFPAFDASPGARPGVYHVIANTTSYAVWDATGDTVLATGQGGSPVRFSGIALSLPRDHGGREINLQVVPFTDAVIAAQQQIQAEPVHRDANLVRLTCVGSTALLAHDLCSAVAESYLRLRIELQQSAAAATAHFLRGQVAQLGQQLTAAEDSAEAFGRRHHITNLDQQASEEVRQMAAVKAQRDQLEAERSALAELIKGVESADGGRGSSHDIASFPTFVRNPGVTDLLQSLVQLENRRSELSVRRTARNPELAALSGRITAIENQLRSYALTYEQGLSAQVRSLDSTLEHGGRRIAVIPGWQAQTARLERRVSLVQELHRLLETRLREAEIARSMSLPSVSIVDVASMSSAPTIPNVRLNLALGFTLGSIFGLALALYRERGNTRIYDREELELATSLPVLSMLPVVRKRGPLARVSSASAEGAPDPAFFQEGILVSTRRPHSRGQRLRLSFGSGSDGAVKQVAFEAFRSLGTDLHLSGEGIRSIMVTSAGPGEGKTFTACNLAIASVSRGARVLLIDADLRACGVSAFLHLPRSSPGLSDVLVRQTTLRAVEKQFRVNGVGELCVIPAGTSRHESGSLLEREEFTLLLAQVRSAFDLVILDTPPLNIIADAATIAAKVDATLLVVRSGMTDREALRLTLERLERTHGPVAGVVLNGVELPSQYSSYSYQHA